MTKRLVLLGGLELLTHRTRLLLIGAVLTLALAATLLIQTPEATRTIEEVLNDPNSLEGRKIAIRGEVLDGSIDNSTNSFVIHGETMSLDVDFSKAAVSNGLDDNRTVYAEGTLIKKDGVWVFEAEIIKTSCPSKYEEQAE
ncbi:MAG TPA: hypothetical protein EYQ73_05765 [Candidatus Poseidoniales archaeon]|nr:MAG: hypothetical protein CXT71_04845 [Euryarchaeota archaeon]HIF46285.1 hypothetical protein [Candidatus Poseidoniales archaeon]HIL64769.1 hypothetical protein [Candidatus Poseidoniales archaeon]